MTALLLQRTSLQAENELPLESTKLKSESGFWWHFRVACHKRWETLIVAYFSGTYILHLQAWKNSEMLTICLVKLISILLNYIGHIGHALHTWIQSRLESWGVLFKIAFTGTLQPKRVPFSDFKYMRGLGFHGSIWKGRENCHFGW